MYCTCEVVYNIATLEIIARKDDVRSVCNAYRPNGSKIGGYMYVQYTVYQSNSLLINNKLELVFNIL